MRIRPSRERKSRSVRILTSELTGFAQIESETFEFPDPKVERLVSLTPADRKWMDDVVQTIEESWTSVRSNSGHEHCAFLQHCTISLII